MSASTLVLNLAYVILLSATVARTVLRLRMVLIGAALGFIAFGLLVQNWTMVGWNISTGTLHAIQLFRFLAVRRGIELDDEAQSVREKLFPALDRFDFYTLWALGETQEFGEGPITVAGEPNAHAHLILDGTAVVEWHDRTEIKLSQHDLVGELSFVTGEPATATVRPTPAVRVRTWGHSQLAALDDLNPPAAKAFNRLLRTQLAVKVTR